MEKSSSAKQNPYVAPSDSVRKIVFLGDTGVGKSSLISRFVSNSNHSGGPTIGAAEHTR